MSRILLRNESSLDFLLFDHIAISNYSIKNILNWEDTQVIGRMDPIRNFKNTESVLDIKFNVKAPCIYYIEGDAQPQDEETLYRNFYKDAYPFREQAVLSKRIHQQGSVVKKFFYPSYEELDTEGVYYMKSAPVFRVKVSEDIFEGYCVIKDFTLVADAERHNGSAFSDYDLNLTFHIIHETPGQVSSTIYKKTAQETEDEITGL